MIALEDVSITQGAFKLDKLSMQVPTGAYAVLMGTTGCGKSTILEAICGLRAIREGRILIQGRDVTRWKPAARGVGFVPQDGALFKTMTVRENLAFALTLRRQERARIQRRVEAQAGFLGITHLLDRRIHGLSGGERQRIAMGRALIFEPAILLLDEPLSSVDEDTHEAMCTMLKDVQARSGATLLHVTHSRREARRLGDLGFQLMNGQLSKVETWDKPAGQGHGKG